MSGWIAVSLNLGIEEREETYICVYTIYHCALWRDN